MKGGFQWWLPKKIVITTPYRPEHTFKTREDISQLLRRIDEIREFTGDNCLEDSADAELRGALRESTSEY